MFNKIIRNKIKLGLGLMLCATAIFIAPATSITSFAAPEESASTYENYREWVFKIENGKLYKALYNRSTGLYETDWIYLCEWPPEE